MTSDYYERNTIKGILALLLVGGSWELRLYTESNPSGIVIRSDYPDPDQAAFYASRADFGIQEFDELFRGVYIPSDLKQWRTSRSIYRRKIVNPYEVNHP